MKHDLETNGKSTDLENRSFQIENLKLYNALKVTGTVVETR